jgi:PleD family two-component response regulator
MPESADALITKADNLMYAVKNNGKKLCNVCCVRLKPQAMAIVS